MMKYFKGNHSVIRYEFSVNKITLVFTDEASKDRLHFIGYGFSYDFHDDIAEGYGYIISGFEGVFLFRNKSDKSLVETLRTLLVV